MSKGKLITRCGECVDYDYKKHRCRRGCNEGEPQEPFYTDCPLPTVDTDQVCKPTEWISVDERLPERNGRYMTHCKIEGQSLVCILYYCNVGGFNEGTVTHWMPLPDPPDMKGGAE